MSGLKNILESLKKRTGDTVMSRIDRMLLGRNEVASEVEGFLHPSSMVPWKKGWDHVCARELYFTRFAGLSVWPKALLVDDFSPRTFRIFDNGQWVHRRWQAYLIQAGMTDPRVGVGWEIPVHDDELGITGHADAIVYPEAYGHNEVELEFHDHGVPKYTKNGGFVYKVKSNGGRWIPKGDPILIDVKSTKDEYWKLLADRPSPEHTVQMMCYLALLNLSRCHMLYESKNTQEVKEIVLPFDATQWAFFRRTLLEVSKAKEVGRELPRRFCSSAIESRAQECPWNTVCFACETPKGLVQLEQRVAGGSHGKKKR